MATKDGRQAENGLDHVARDVDITPNRPKSRLILSVTTKCDLWSKMANQDGR